MNSIMLALLLLPGLAVGAAKTAEPTPTPAPLSATAATEPPHAWMEGGRLLVSGSSTGLVSELEARHVAVQEAAKVAAEFLEKKGLGPSREIRRGVENAILRETPLKAVDYGDVKLENVCQERWSNEGGIDRYSMHLVISISVGQKKKASK